MAETRRLRLPADKAFILLVVALAPLTNVKIAGAEPINFVAVAVLILVFAIARHQEISMVLSGRLVPLARAWVIFVLLATILALWLDWNLKFYVPSGSSLMRHPPILTLTRTWKLGIDIGLMFVLVSFFSQDPRLVRYCARTYLAVGIFNAIYGTICFILCVAGVASGDYDSLFGAYTVDNVTRARGFFIEGGPFGLYIVTVLLVLLVERSVLRDVSRSLFASCAAILTVALLATQSKASFCLIAILMLWSLCHMHKLRYIIPASALALGLLAWFVIGNFEAKIAGYVFSYQNLQSLARADSENGSLVMGRVAAAYVVPAIVADRPLLGVGLGNYPVMRNNPDYSWPLPPAPGWDSGGLGLGEAAAELGIPLLLFLVVLVWTPVWIAKRASAHAFVVLLAGCQFWLHVFGASIPFVYPYLTTALALGLSSGPKPKQITR